MRGELRLVRVRPGPRSNVSQFGVVCVGNCDRFGCDVRSWDARRVTGRSEPWWVADRAAQFRGFASADGRTAPLYRRLADATADDTEVMALLDAAPRLHQRTVLLFAAVHALVLDEPGSELAAFYPSVRRDIGVARRDGEDPWPAFRSFCLDHRAAIEAIVATRTTQTNEVGRCLAFLPALQAIHRATDAPLRLLEVGASGGLNLALDRYRLGYGAPAVPLAPSFEPVVELGPVSSPVRLGVRVFGDIPVPVEPEVPPIAARAGLDRSPIDVTDDGAVRWLEACVFPDRLDRLARLRAAVHVARRDPPTVLAGDGVIDLPRAAAGVSGDGPLVVMHSWVLTYFDDADAFARQVAALAADQDVWWVTVEPSSAVPGLEVAPRDPRYLPEMAANTVVSLLHVRPDRRDDLVLARSHPHLDWIHWLA